MHTMQRSEAGGFKAGLLGWQALVWGLRHSLRPTPMVDQPAHQSSTSSRLIMAAARLRTVTPAALRRSMLGGGSACKPHIDMVQRYLIGCTL